MVVGQGNGIVRLALLRYEKSSRGEFFTQKSFFRGIKVHFYKKKFSAEKFVENPSPNADSLGVFYALFSKR